MSVLEGIFRGVCCNENSCLLNIKNICVNVTPEMTSYLLKNSE